MFSANVELLVDSDESGLRARPVEGFMLRFKSDQTEHIIKNDCRS